MTSYVVSVGERHWEEWRPGVRTRSWSGEIDGAREIRVGEQCFEPGRGVPAHWHTYEEHLLVIDGTMQAEVDGKAITVQAPSCLIIPARVVHAFTNPGPGRLHIMAALGAPIHESFFLSFPEGEAIREYEARQPGGARRRVRVDHARRTVEDVSS